jgi:hypothetical protein
VTPKLWLLDHGALWAVRVGDALGGPFYRLERWLTERWFAERERAR